MNLQPRKTYARSAGIRRDMISLRKARRPLGTDGGGGNPLGDEDTNDALCHMGGNAMFTILLSILSFLPVPG